jgi:transcriptional regulator with XRE-family HTH domain
VPVSVHHPRYQALQAELAAVRRAAGLSQVELSEVLGVGQSYVSKVERGEMYVDVMVFIDWCKACRVRPEESIARLT